jgi:putative transposase
MLQHPPAPTRPVPLRPGEVEEALVRFLPSETIERFARETAFVQRERKIDPVAFLWTLVLDFGVELHRHLAELKAGYVERAQLPLSYPGFYLRFTPELSKFLQRCLAHALGELARESGRELDSRLTAFGIEDLLIKDTSVVRLHAALASKWPATRTRKVAAGVKVDLLVSVCANGPKTVGLVGERTADVKLLRIGPWVKSRILLIDLGHYSHRHFAKISENGGYFVTRWKTLADPLLVRSLQIHRGRAIDLEGQRLKDVLPRLEREVLDGEVELAFQRRAYNGRHSGDAFRCRLVAVWDEAHREYHVYLTNLGPEILSAEEVAKLYAQRWEVELVFKELKSHYALDAFRTTKANVVEALIWSALLTLAVARRLHTLVRMRAAPELRARYTQLRFAVNFRRGARVILGAVLSHLGLSSVPADPFALNLYLVEESLDPHLHRRRFREEWSR